MHLGYFLSALLKFVLHFGSMSWNLIFFLVLSGVALAQLVNAIPTYQTGNSTYACEDYDDCRLACGTGVLKFKCHPQGFCTCIGKFMPAIRCRKLSPKDTKCQMHCDSFKSSPRRCQTKQGRICSCFVYSGL